MKQQTIKTKKGILSLSSIAFEKSMNKDLFYSLHNVNISSTGNKVAKKWYHKDGFNGICQLAYRVSYKANKLLLKYLYI